MKIRRCQGWEFSWAGTFHIPAVNRQCEQPATDGVHCDHHHAQIPEEWMEEPCETLSS